MNYIDDLNTTVARATPMLLALPDAVNARRPAPGKWSPKEIIGHLIDSACNNHQRFVRIRSQGELVFPGYDQDAWVAAGDYQNAPWPDLVALWAGDNRHMARVMAKVPPEIRMKQHRRHNLDEIAFRAVPADQPATLDYFMADYVAHLHHHLRQIAALAGWPNDATEIA
jgi:hypothetical protein